MYFLECKLIWTIVKSNPCGTIFPIVAIYFIEHDGNIAIGLFLGSRYGENRRGLPRNSWNILILIDSSAINGTFHVAYKSSHQVKTPWEEHFKIGWEVSKCKHVGQSGRGVRPSCAIYVIHWCSTRTWWLKQLGINLHKDGRLILATKCNRCLKWKSICISKAWITVPACVRSYY